MDIIEITENKSDVCRAILEALPEWFGIEEARERYIAVAQDLPVFACLVEDVPVAFLALKYHTPFAAEIHSMGVLPRWHRRGLGRGLLRRAEQQVAAQGIRFLTVKTLSSSHPDENYEATRRFYRAVGFVDLEELPDLWGAENPCLTMIKVIGD